MREIDQTLRPEDYAAVGLNPPGTTVFLGESMDQNPGRGRWGAIIRAEQSTRNLSGAVERTTNHEVLYCAAIHVLSGILSTQPAETDMTFISTNKHVVKTMGWHIRFFKQQQWLKKDGTPPASVDVLKELDRLSEGRKIRWVRPRSTEEELGVNQATELARSIS